MTLGSRVVLPTAAANLTTMPSALEATLHACSKQRLAESANRLRLHAPPSRRRVEALTCENGQPRSPPNPLTQRDDTPRGYKTHGTRLLAFHC
jgi:hypothetical protein